MSRHTYFWNKIENELRLLSSMLSLCCMIIWCQHSVLGLQASKGELQTSGLQAVCWFRPVASYAGQFSSQL